jgi:hypothetical protein
MTYLYHINNATEFLEDFTEQDARHEKVFLNYW